MSIYPGEEHVREFFEQKPDRVVVSLMVVVLALPWTMATLFWWLGLWPQAYLYVALGLWVWGGTIRSCVREWRKLR